METRVCKKCGVEKELSLSNFPTVKSSTGVKIFRGSCKKCFNEQKNISRRKQRNDPQFRRAELDKEIERRAKINKVKNKEKLAAKKERNRLN